MKMKPTSHKENSMNLCKCGHDRKYYTVGTYERYEDKSSLSGESIFCELPGCYHKGEDSQTCPCVKFKKNSEVEE